jgi:5'-nucleotidase
MTDPADVTDAEVTVALDGDTLGTFPVTTMRPSSPDGSANSNDEAGTAHLTVTVPNRTAGGAQALTVTGATGTSVEVPIRVELPDPVASTMTVDSPASTPYGTDGTVTVESQYGATGAVELFEDGTEVAEGTLVDGVAEIVVDGTALEVGSHALTAQFAGDGVAGPVEKLFSYRVTKAVTTTAATLTPTSVQVKKGTTTANVTVTAEGYVPTGVVGAYVDGSLVKAAELVDGKVSLVLGPFPTVGTRVIEFRYLGDDVAARSTVEATVTVVRQKPKVTST